MPSGERDILDLDGVVGQNAVVDDELEPPPCVFIERPGANSTRGQGIGWIVDQSLGEREHDQAKVM